MERHLTGKGYLAIYWRRKRRRELLFSHRKGKDYTAHLLSSQRTAQMQGLSAHFPPPPPPLTHDRFPQKHYRESMDRQWNGHGYSSQLLSS